MGNPVVHWQMLSKHPDATAKFYGKLFGWKVDAANSLGYRVVSTESGRGIDGGIWPCPPQGHNLVQLFVEVDDVEVCVAQAVKLGAQVIVPKSQLPDGDTLAIVLDPVGQPFGIVRRGP